MTERALHRRDVFAMIGALAAVACGAARGGAGAQPVLVEVDRFKLDPMADLVPAAGLIWLVEASPRAIMASPALSLAAEMVVSPSRFDTFAEHHGGVDIRGADQIVIAAYPRATLVCARTRFDPDRVEAAFRTRVASVEGRTVQRGLRRVWGRTPGGIEEVALLAGEGLIFERGEPGPLRAAVAFAQGRLRRSLPALHAEPLASAAPLVGDAPLRVFAPGPFEGQSAQAIAGLLRATTAVAAAVRPVSDAPDPAVGLRLVLTGGWGQDAPAAAARMRSAFGVLAEDPFGRLIGMNHPTDGPDVSAEPGALRLDVTLDAAVLARGIYAATGANLAEIMDY
jgi:hypothetical protein